MDEIIYEGFKFKKPNHVDSINNYHTIIHNDIKKGKLKKLPCEICGSEKSHAHHEEYSDDYKIRWLCHKHHKIIHSLFDANGMGDFKEYIGLNLHIPKDLDYQLNQHITELSKVNAKISKEKLIIKLVMIGILQESRNLTEHLK